jgi:tetratricopeptide (TPR) repeat protein
MNKRLVTTGAAIIFCCLGILIYSNTFHSSFQFDDHFAIIDNFTIRNICNLQNIWSFYPTRIVTFFTLALNYSLSKLDVYTYHLFNIIIHLGSAILVWLLTSLIFSIPIIKRSDIYRYSRQIALFTALIFLSHPSQTQSVTYIWQRCASLAGFFYLLSVYFYIKTRLAQIDNKPISRWAIFYASSYFFCIMAMFTKENSLSLPFMIILCEAYFFKKDKPSGWKYALYFLPALLIIPLVLFFTNTHPGVIMDLEKYTTNPLSEGGRYFLTQFRVMLTYIRIMFLPLNQNIDYDYPMSKGLMSVETLGSLFILAFIIVSAIRLSKKYPLASFGAFWFLLTILPESSIMPFKDVIVEHRLYLATAGYGLFFVSGLYYLFQERRARFAAVILLILVASYSIMTYERNKAWKDEITLWNDAILKSPNKARPYSNRGLAYQAKGNLDQALLDYNRAIGNEPDLAAEAYLNRGNVYQYKGSLDQAILDYNKVIENEPDYAEAYYNRGTAYHNKGNLDQAILDYNKAIEINPDLAEAYYNLGKIYQNKGNLDQAILDYNKAIEINPDYTDAYNNRDLLNNSKKPLE